MFDAKSTVKEQIVELIQSQGYDFITTCEMATDAIDEFLNQSEPRRTFYIGACSWTLEKKG